VTLVEDDQTLEVLAAPLQQLAESVVLLLLVPKLDVESAMEGVSS